MKTKKLFILNEILLAIMASHLYKLRFNNDDFHVKENNKRAIVYHLNRTNTETECDISTCSHNDEHSKTDYHTHQIEMHCFTHTPSANDYNNIQAVPLAFQTQAQCLSHAHCECGDYVLARANMYRF